MIQGCTPLIQGCTPLIHGYTPFIFCVEDGTAENADLYIHFVNALPVWKKPRPENTLETWAEP
jgi:hypothetical protein